MNNLSSQINQSSGDINYLIIEYLKSIPFLDNTQKDQLIAKVRNIILIFPKLFLLQFCYDLN
jgi:hypothetical protein